MSVVGSAESVVVASFLITTWPLESCPENEDFVLSTTSAYNGTPVRLYLNIMLRPGMLANEMTTRPGRSGTPRDCEVGEQFQVCGRIYGRRTGAGRLHAEVLRVDRWVGRERRWIQWQCTICNGLQ
jgi:hypothetical protein